MSGCSCGSGCGCGGGSRDYGGNGNESSGSNSSWSPPKTDWSPLGRVVLIGVIVYVIAEALYKGTLSFLPGYNFLISTVIGLLGAAGLDEGRLIVLGAAAVIGAGIGLISGISKL